MADIVKRLRSCTNVPSIFHVAKDGAAEIEKQRVEIEQQEIRFARWIGLLMEPLDSDQYTALPADLRDWWIVKGAELYRQRLQTGDSS